MKLRRVEYSTGTEIDKVGPHWIKVGWFHGCFQWQNEGRAGCLATIEHEDGTVDVYAPGYIRFLDTPPEEDKSSTEVNCEHQTCRFAIESRPGRGLAKPDLSICSCDVIEVGEHGNCVTHENGESKP